MVRLTFGIAVGAALVGAALFGPGRAGAGAPATAPPILYVQGVSCPAHKTCTGNPRYYSRIREIPKVGLASRSISSGAFSDTEPAWSPDHTRIAFVRESHNGVSYAIWTMRADGTRAIQLTHGNTVDVEPSWSPDGKSLVFRGNSTDGKSFDLYTVGAAGGGLKNLTSNTDNVSVTDPSWSTGNLIAFERTKQNAGAGTGIYTIRPDGSGLKRVTLGGLDPAWSPSGRKLAFVLPAGSDGSLEISTVNANGTGRARLTNGLESTAPAWSPDGRQIVFLRDTQIAVMNADGSHIKQLTKPLHGEGFVDTPAW